MNLHKVHVQVKNMICKSDKLCCCCLPDCRDTLPFALAPFSLLPFARHRPSRGRRRCHRCNCEQQVDTKLNNFIRDTRLQLRLPCVTPPQWTQLLLSANVPDEKLGALRFAHRTAHLFTIEADRGHRIQVLVELQPIESRCFAGRVKAEHHNV